MLLTCFDWNHENQFSLTTCAAWDPNGPNASNADGMVGVLISICSSCWWQTSITKPKLLGSSPKSILPRLGDIPLSLVALMPRRLCSFASTVAAATAIPVSWLPRQWSKRLKKKGINQTLITLSWTVSVFFAVLVTKNPSHWHMHNCKLLANVQFPVGNVRAVKSWRG